MLFHQAEPAVSYLFFLPIVLAALWYGFKGMAVPAFLGSLHIGVSFLMQDYLINPCMRAFLFMLGALVLSYLVEWNSHIQRSLFDFREDTESTLSEIHQHLAAVEKHMQRG